MLVGEDDKEDDELVGVSDHLVSPKNKKNPNPTQSGTVQKFQAHETIESLQANIQKLHSRNMMLSRQVISVSKMGGVDRYEVMQLRKMVKEDLFKRVKFITTTAMKKHV